MKDRQLLLSPAPVSAPRVESPVTPHNSSAPPSLSHALTNLKLEHAVSIEEVDCSSASGSISGGCSPDIQEAVTPASAPHSPVKDIPSPLSMFNSNQSKSLPRGTSNHYLINSGLKPYLLILFLTDYNSCRFFVLWEWETREAKWIKF